MANILKQLLILAAVLALFSVAAQEGSSNCGENERFTNCGTACPLTCATPRPQICTLQCIVGCACVRGYVRNSANNCVRPSDC